MGSGLRGTCGRYYLTVDSRISRDHHHHLNPSSLYETKPDWTPEAPVGVEIVIEIVRELQFTQTFTRSQLSLDAVWGGVDGEVEERPKVVGARIIRLQGMEGTHRCAHCEEYSAVNPSPRSPCKGCKKASWEPWLEERPKLGEIPNPRSVPKFR